MALTIFFVLSSNYFLKDENYFPRTKSKGILPNRFSLCPPLSHPPQANGPKRYSDRYDLFADQRLLAIVTVTHT